MATKKPITQTETPESKLAEISKEVVKVEKQASSIVVKTQEDYDNASIFLSSVIKPRLNRVTALLKFFTDPYVEQRRVALQKKQEIEELFEKQLSPLQRVETAVKTLMSGYLREEDRKARAEEDRLAKLREKQNERREEAGKAPVLTPLPTIARPQATVQAEDGGKSTAKKVWKFKVIDINKVPRNYLRCEVVHAEVQGAILTGVRQIEGLEIFEDFDVSVSASKY